jgi:flagellar motor component MotA
MVAPSADGLNLVVDQHHSEKVRQLLDTGSNDTEARQHRPARRQGHFQLLTPAVVGLVTAYRAVLQARVVQLRYRAGVAAP